jgi:uncharacterized protein DUF6064
MSEWWTYRLSDFLMFSPRAYWRMVELYNSEVWPAQLIGVGAGFVLLWLAALPRPAASRIIAALLAVAWLWVGWAFHWQHYAAINWAARYFAGAFWLQAVLLVIFGVLRGGAQAPPAAAVPNLGWTLAVCGVVLYPLAGLAAGRPWSQAEVFGLMPEPTALASLGLLLAGGQPRAKVLSIVPTLSFVVGMATLWMLST